MGGLFALQRYGLDYKQLNTLAGVSAGAVIVACLSVSAPAAPILLPSPSSFPLSRRVPASPAVAGTQVGYDAEAIYRLVTKMPFHRLAYPELGALFRALGNTLLTLLQASLALVAARSLPIPPCPRAGTGTHLLYASSTGHPQAGRCAMGAARDLARQWTRDQLGC